MTSIQIGRYSFDLSEPYAEGHSLTPAEAKVLNSQRTERLRNLIYKKLQALGPALLETHQLIALNAEVAALDQAFTFVPHTTSQRQKGTLQNMVWEVALESARATITSRGLSPEEDEIEDEIEEIALALCNSPKIIEEARRRFLAHQEVTKAALAELLR